MPDPRPDDLAAVRQEAQEMVVNVSGRLAASEPVGMEEERAARLVSKLLHALDSALPPGGDR